MVNSCRSEAAISKHGDVIFDVTSSTLQTFARNLLASKQPLYRIISKAFPSSKPHDGHHNFFPGQLSPVSAIGRVTCGLILTDIDTFRSAHDLRELHQGHFRFIVQAQRRPKSRGKPQRSASDHRRNRFVPLFHACHSFGIEPGPDYAILAAPSAIVAAIQSTGRDAILRGTGGSNSQFLPFHIMWSFA
jgi:hypothetical protein